MLESSLSPNIPAQHPRGRGRPRRAGLCHAIYGVSRAPRHTIYGVRGRRRCCHPRRMTPVIAYALPNVGTGLVSLVFLVIESRPKHSHDALEFHLGVVVHGGGMYLAANHALTQKIGE